MQSFLRDSDNVEVLRLALIASARYTPLLEILDLFGVECVVRLLDAFAGSTVHIPSKENIVRAVRDTGMYVRVVRNNESINSVAQRFGVDWHTVRTRCRRLQEELDAVTQG